MGNLIESSSIAASGFSLLLLQILVQNTMMRIQRWKLWDFPEHERKLYTACSSKGKVIFGLKTFFSLASHQFYMKSHRLHLFLSPFQHDDFYLPAR